MAVEQQTFEREEEEKKAKLALEKLYKIQSKSDLETVQTLASVTMSE